MVYRVGGLLLLICGLAGAETNDDCAMTQLRKVNEHHEVKLDEKTNDTSQSAQTDDCPTPCVLEEATKICQQAQNKGFSFKTNSCSFKCNAKGKVQNWKGPTLAKLLHHPCQDSHEGPAAYCQKNPSKFYRDKTCSIQCFNGQAMTVAYKGSFSVSSTCSKQNYLLQSSAETFPPASQLADEDED
ncbi:unnamed protein product [Durusdinium trenchii]|uniref:Secreted protein n=1 Tax=Durusdinium trenchii TaxID=1381693 RepID=A0ABP0Q810_9DINO